MMFLFRVKAQVGIEFMVAVVSLLLVFTLVALLSLRKSEESTELKEFISAKMIAMRFAENINMVSEQGSGYWRYFHLPKYIYGEQNYSLNVAGSLVEISWGSRGWSTYLLTGNVHLHCLDLGENYTNRVVNEGGVIHITCHRPELEYYLPHFYLNSTHSGEPVNVSFSIINTGPVNATDFKIRLCYVRIENGEQKCQEFEVSNLGTQEKMKPSFLLNFQFPGTYRLEATLDALNEVHESIESNNMLIQNYTITSP